jgi:DNA invertase Pin-like site-specific DNA recombinase
MIAAIYARKSTEQLGVGDEAKSVARQVEHATAYATKKGWHVAEHVYVDDGVSGAEFVKRPGLARLMNAVMPRAPFQFLVMAEESRLGREAIETGYLLKQIMDAGVRVFFYLEDRERTLDTAMDKVMLSLANFAAEVEREKGSQRVYDAARQRAAAGKVAGAKIYGYDNVPMLSTELGRDGRPKRLYTERRVNEAQADVVRRIFSLYVEGIGITRIAHQLNDEGVPAPRAAGWAQSGVKGMLRNEIYRGVVLWGRIQNVVRKGTAKHRQRPPEEWIRREDPALRIVPEELWARVHARFRHRAARDLRSDAPMLCKDGKVRRGTLVGRPSWRDGHSDYLLTGFAECALCTGAMRTVTQVHGTLPKRWTVRQYGCATNQNRGPAKCVNNTRLRQEVLDEAFLQCISGLLDEEMLGWAVDEVIRRLQTGQEGYRARRLQLEQDLARVEHRLQRGLDEFLNGADAMPEVKVRVQEDRQRKAGMLEELASLEGLATAVSLDETRLRAELATRARDVRALLGGHIPQGRAMLRRLLAYAVKMEPIVRDGRVGYRFWGQLTYDRLLSGEALGHSVTGRISCD